MCSDVSDDTDSFNAILNVFDMLLSCYGIDEDEIGKIEHNFLEYSYTQCCRRSYRGSQA